MKPEGTPHDHGRRIGQRADRFNHVIASGLIGFVGCRTDRTRGKGFAGLAEFSMLHDDGPL